VQVIFNAFKRIAAQYSEAEKTALFSKTATEFHRPKLGCWNGVVFNLGEFALTASQPRSR
jgi:hypothetical protein